MISVDEMIKIEPTDNSIVQRYKNEFNLHFKNAARQPENPAPQYNKGVALRKIGKEIDQMGYYNYQALECFNKAVTLSNAQNPKYLADRSKLLSEIGNFDASYEDIAKASRLPESSLQLETIYTSKTIKDIVRSVEIQNRVTNSRNIHPELKGILNEHLKITGRILLRVDVHDDKISSLESAVRDLVSDMNSIREDLTKGIDLNHGRIEDYVQKVKLIEEKVLKNEHKTESKLDQISQDLDETIKIVEDQANKIEEGFVKQEQIVGDLYKISEDISAIEVIIKQLDDKLGVSEKEAAEIKDWVRNLDLNSKQYDQLLKDISPVIEYYHQQEKEKLLMKEIENNPYKSAFYHTLVDGLFMTYLSAKLVQKGSGIITNSKSGKLGSAGVAAQTVGKIVNFLGVIQVIGDGICLIDNFRQGLLVKNFSDIASSEEDMKEIVKTLGMILVSDEIIQSYSYLDKQAFITRVIEYFFGGRAKKIEDQMVEAYKMVEIVASNPDHLAKSSFITSSAKLFLSSKKSQQEEQTSRISYKKAGINQAQNAYDRESNDSSEEEVLPKTSYKIKDKQDFKNVHDESGLRKDKMKEHGENHGNKILCLILSPIFKKIITSEDRFNKEESSTYHDSKVVVIQKILKHVLQILEQDMLYPQLCKVIEDRLSGIGCGELEKQKETASYEDPDQIENILRDEGSTQSKSIIQDNKLTITEGNKNNITTLKVGKFTSTQERFIFHKTAEIIRKLEEEKYSAVNNAITEAEFAKQIFHADTVIDVIKELADFEFGRGNHTVARGLRTVTSFYSKKINLSKLLSVNYKYCNSAYVDGKEVIDLVKECKLSINYECIKQLLDSEESHRYSTGRHDESICQTECLGDLSNNDYEG